MLNQGEINLGTDADLKGAWADPFWNITRAVISPRV